MLMRMLTVILGVMERDYNNGHDDGDDDIFQLADASTYYSVQVDRLMQPRPKCRSPMLEQLMCWHHRGPPFLVPVASTLAARDRSLVPVPASPAPRDPSRQGRPRH